MCGGRCWVSDEGATEAPFSGMSIVLGNRLPRGTAGG